MKGAAHSKVEWRRLGEFIEECDERNECLKYSVDSVRGVSIEKKLIPTKANMEGVSLKSYKLLKPGEFCFVPDTSRRSDHICIAPNLDDLSYLVSSVYDVFRIGDESRLLTKYLHLYFSRTEFDRYARFNSWGSAREVFSYADMVRVEIPVPSIDVQRNVVETWQGLRKMKEENEGLVEPLLALCRSYLQDCKKKYPMKEIGQYIREIREKNTDNQITLEQGINISKEFISPQRSNSDLSSRVVVRTGQFAYCTQLNNENVAIAYRTGPDCVVSPVYNVFEITEKDKLLDEYLFLWLIRPELGRYVYWASRGSAYEFLVYENLCSAKIAIPPIEVQQAIVDVYRCANEAKRIAAEADRLSREICPALVRWAAEGG